MLSIEQLTAEKHRLEVQRDQNQQNVEVLTLYIASIEARILAEEEFEQGVKN